MAHEIRHCLEMLIETKASYLPIEVVARICLMLYLESETVKRLFN